MTGPWAEDFLLLAPHLQHEPVTLLPFRSGALAVVVTSGGLVKAFVFPRRACFHDLQLYCQRLFGLPSVPLKGPPALRAFCTRPLTPCTFRSGDTFALLIPETFHAYRPVQRPVVSHLSQLPHLNLWSIDFIIEQGGWVSVWDDAGPPEAQCERFWIDDGSMWTAMCRQFRKPCDLPRHRAWVPVPCLGDGVCHFVRATDPGEARVLLHDPAGEDDTECRLLTNVDQNRFLPLGWCLRPDVAQREQEGGLRDGDVLIPVRSRAHAIGPLGLLFGTRLAFLPRLGWIVLCLGFWSSAMYAPPLEQQSVLPTPVGKYSWRVPSHAREMHEAVLPGTRAALLSPFSPHDEPFELNPDSLEDDIYVALSSHEPVWYHAIVPVWPALGLHRLTFVPAPPCPDLVCIIVVSAEWQLPVLIPRRADLHWVLAHVHRHTPGAIVAIRAPIGAAAQHRSDCDAIDWRNGDVLLAIEWHAPGSSLACPVFMIPEHVRHSALWMMDFRTTCVVELIIWRPGQPPVTTEMPAEAIWHAESQRFLGRFETKYPGAWTPVPWAYSDLVNLCQRSPDPALCNVLVETVRLIGHSHRLRAVCHTVHQASSRHSIAGALNLPTADLRLLGVADYVDPADSHSSSLRGQVALVSLLGLRFGLLPALVALVGFAWAAPPAPGAVPEVHWLWSPYQGCLGPARVSSSDDIDAALVALEPIWSRGFVRVVPKPDRYHAWVPRSLSPALVSVLLFGPPRAVVQMLPPVLPRALLLRIMRHLFGEVAAVAGRQYGLRERASADGLVPLNDGDLLVAVMATWAPSIQARWPTHFGSIAEARAQGLWSHPLSFCGSGWALFWHVGQTSPTPVPLRGKQVWDPSVCVLRPAFNHLADGWWPRLHEGYNREPHVHFVLAHSQEARDSRRDGRQVLPSAIPQECTAVSWEACAASSGSSRAARPCVMGFALLAFTSAARWRGKPAAAAWCLLACYLAAWAAPGRWVRDDAVNWSCSLEDTCRLQAWLHQFWRQHPLRPCLPLSFPLAYQYAWLSYPSWPGGVPQEVLLATDGTGLGQGSAAFVAWAYHGARWYRIGWFASDLPSVAWSEADATPTGQLSFLGEVVALQSAGLWAASMCDCWQLYMGCRPRKITIAVDNTSALQIAAGAASASGRPSQWCRAIWQAVQARSNTCFRHVPSHSGFLVNTIADALADYASRLVCGAPAMYCPLPALQTLIAQEGQWLWLLPAAVMRNGVPSYCTCASSTLIAGGPEETHQLPPEPAQVQAAAPLPLHIVTANVQSLKDAASNPFNPSGHAVRRQYFYDQLHRQKIDVACLQETRGKAGRWSTAGVLTWRSGALKGQYGCEVWVRPDVVAPPLSLLDFRILASQPRLIVVTCVSPRFPVTLCAAHAPHSERPDAEAECFWREFREALNAAPVSRGLVVGLDANGDLTSTDEAGCLIGTHLATHDPGRNDMLLLDGCLQLGLEAPATFPEFQVGERWSWTHSGGRCKRLDHLLFRPGPWAHRLTSQALDFDLATANSDHVALRARTVLYAPARVPLRPSFRPCPGSAVLAHGAALWDDVRARQCRNHSTGHQVSTLLECFAAWRKRLPSRAPVVTKQPYISDATREVLGRLRDWRAMLRHSKQRLRDTVCYRWFRRWARKPAPQGTNVHLHCLRLYAAAIEQQVRRASLVVHRLARQDKCAYFSVLTGRAASEWHQHGRPLEAIAHLKWASRRSAERRAVHAAGGYQIDAALEEQFRAQEGAQRVTAQQLEQVARDWWSQPPTPCYAAMPTLLQLETAARSQASGKAPGPDGIPNELWNRFPVYAGHWLWTLCAHIGLSGREPYHFKRAIVCALYKKGPASLPENYRSIALLNGIAKIWHGHLRRSIGASILAQYDPLQLGGRSGVPVSFAVAACRAASDLCTAQGRCEAILYIDIQAAYYEASRALIFSGDPSLLPPPEAHLRHLLFSCPSSPSSRGVTSTRSPLCGNSSAPGLRHGVPLVSEWQQPSLPCDTWLAP